MRKTLFYNFRPLILASKIDQQIMFLKAASWTSFFSFFTDFFQKWSILGPQWSKMASKISQVASKWHGLTHTRGGRIFRSWNRLLPGSLLERSWIPFWLIWDGIWMIFWYFVEQRTIKSWQKSSEIFTMKLHGHNSPLSKTPAAATNACTETPSYKMGGRRCSRLMAHSDPPPPARRGQGVWNSLQIWRILTDWQTPKALRGPRLCRRPFLPNRSFHTSALIFSDCLHFLGRSKIHQKSDLYQTFPKPQKLDPGCPKLDFGAILVDFWHHFFDQFSWPT